MVDLKRTGLEVTGRSLLVPFPLSPSRPCGREGVEEGSGCQLLLGVPKVARYPVLRLLGRRDDLFADRLYLVQVFLLRQCQMDSGGLVVGGFPGLHE